MFGQSAFDVDSAYFDDPDTGSSMGRVHQEVDPSHVSKRREVKVTRVHKSDGGGRGVRNHYSDDGGGRGVRNNYSDEGGGRGVRNHYSDDGGAAPRDNGRHGDFEESVSNRDSRDMNHRGDTRFNSRDHDRGMNHRDTRNMDAWNDTRGVSHNDGRDRHHRDDTGHVHRADGHRHTDHYSEDAKGRHHRNGIRYNDTEDFRGEGYEDEWPSARQRDLTNHTEIKQRKDSESRVKHTGTRGRDGTYDRNNGVYEGRTDDSNHAHGTNSRERQQSRQGSHSSSTREVNDHLEQIETLERGPRGKPLPGGKKFFRKVQHELEELREEWKDEVEKLTEMSLAQNIPKNAQTQGTNSFIDTSSGKPIFTALVDVIEFHPNSVEVDYDHLTNKVIVKGRNMNGIGTMTKTFTQKVQLPRYADDQNLSTKLSRAGILKIEVPLMYYFPQQQHKGRDVKSFVNEVRTNRDGSQTLEILVNTGPGVRAKDLHVQVSEDRELLVTANKDVDGRSVRKLIKRYNLPAKADVDRIRSKMGKDGRLMVLVPLYGH